MGVKVRFRNGGWWLYIDHRGRRRAKKVGDRATALEAARQVRAKLLAGDLSLFGAESETFERYAKRWLAQTVNYLKASTRSFYAGHLEQHIFPLLGSKPVSALRRADCRQLVAACRELRHTFASLLLQAGEPITYVSQQLGHKDASITLRVYAHWLPDTTAGRVSNASMMDRTL